MRYFIENQTPQALINPINLINDIEFESNQEVIRNETLIISLDHAEKFLQNRFVSAANHSFGIVQSFIQKSGERVHLIIINENLCNTLQADIISVVLHEIGHIINEFGQKITTVQAIQRNITNLKEENDRIRMENEFHADYIVKHYGFLEGALQNLRVSLGQNFDDEKLRQRIATLEGDEIRLTNNIRTHTV